MDQKKQFYLCRIVFIVIQSNKPENLLFSLPSRRVAVVFFFASLNNSIIIIGAVSAQRCMVGMVKYLNSLNLVED